MGSWHQAGCSIPAPVYCIRLEGAACYVLCLSTPATGPHAPLMPLRPSCRRSSTLVAGKGVAAEPTAHMICFTFALTFPLAVAARRWRAGKGVAAEPRRKVHAGGVVCRPQALRGERVRRPAACITWACIAAAPAPLDKRYGCNKCEAAWTRSTACITWECIAAAPNHLDRVYGCSHACS